ncbi:MAG: peptidoglycan DD-metalloendopeptidase family protein [Gammaproteobacteria bacterium]|jgi:lipoprotein NlpD
MLLHRTCITILLLLLLTGCGFAPINAPVDSRGIRSESHSPPRVPPVRQRPAGNADIYVVRRGDTLYSIAWKYGLSYQQLAAMNGVRAPYTIYVGQHLRVRPAPAAGRPAVPARAVPARQVPARTAPAKRVPVSRPAPVRQAPLKPPPPAPVPAVSPPPPTSSPTAASGPSASGNSKAAYAQFDGKWTWPTLGRVLSGFNARAPGKKGIHIGGHSEQPVKAAASGKVVYVGSGLVGYGRLIIIKHNDSLLSAYGHNSKLLVVEGDHVEIGQTIATMGSSGADRTALYFEVRKDGKPVNPLNYLPKKG